MRLRALAGSYAGEIREYSAEAARAALASGVAERLDEAWRAKDERPAIAVSTKQQPLRSKRQRSRE